MCSSIETVKLPFEGLVVVHRGGLSFTFAEWTSHVSLMPPTPAIELQDIELGAVLAFIDEFGQDGNTFDAASATTAVDRVERQRQKAQLKARRQYYSKLKTMRDLRARVATLNQQLTTIAAQRASPASSNAELSEIDPRAKTVELILQTQRLQVQLEAEGSLLRKLLSDSYLHMTKLRDILNAEHQLYLAHSSFFLVLKPLTPSDCQKKLEEAQIQVNNFSTVAGSLDLTRIVCEWSEKRFTNGGNFHTSIHKTLYRKSAQVLFGQTWRAFTSQWEKLFSQGMAASCRLVQLIDDDNILFCQNYSAEPMLPGKTDVNAVNMMALVSRISTSTGFLITHRGLQRDSVEIQDLLKSPSDDQQSEIWLEHFCWIHFEQIGKHCIVTVGGISPALRASSYFWMSGFVQFALRWEIVVIGQRFILP